jgi:hypothetical protein
MPVIETTAPGAQTEIASSCGSGSEVSQLVADALGAAGIATVAVPAPLAALSFAALVIASCSV